MRVGIAAAVAALGFLLAACGGGGGGGGTGGAPGGGGGNGGGVTPPPANRPPVASAGPDFTAAIVPTGYQIDGSASTDPDGTPLSYVWSIVSEPAGADATITGESVPLARLNAMAPGSYVIGLRVVDPAGAENTDTVTVTLTNDAPVAVAEVSATRPAVADEVLLNAGGSSDANGHPLTFTWRLTRAPNASNLRQSFTGAVVSLNFDVAGDYAFSLEASDGYTSTVVETETVRVSTYAVQTLNAPFRHIAEQPGGGVIVSVHERALLVIRDGREAAVTTLPAVGTSVAISPNGALAAVAHETSVSVIDLSTYTVMATHDAGGSMHSVAIADDGYIYTTRSSGGSWRNVVTISPAGVASVSYVNIFEGSGPQMHPSGGRIYFADRNVSPADIRRISFDAGQILGQNDSPYHGDYYFCGDAWVAADGNSLLSKCGVTLRLRDNPLADMTFAYQLTRQGGASLSVAQAAYSRFVHRWFVVPENGGSSLSPQILIFDAATGQQSGVLTLPESDSGRQLYAKAVYPSQTRDEVHILAQDHLTNPQEYYLLNFKTPSTEVLDFPPTLIVQTQTAGRAGRPVRIDAGASFDPEGNPLTFSWSLTSQPAMSSLVLTDMTGPALQFTPVVAGRYVMSVTASDGARESGPRTVTIDVAAGGAPMVYRMDGHPADAEFSKALNLFVYIADDKAELRLLQLDDLSETRLALPRVAHRIGISPDGRTAAISHPGMASLVDLQTGRVVQSVEYSADWGDIVLDRRGRAHLIPNRDQWTSLISIDFATGTAQAGGIARAGSKMRLHPNGDWAYSATVDTSPSRMDKWLLTGMPGSPTGGFPYHGHYAVHGNVWISEDGDAILAASGNVFNTSADQSVDMFYRDSLQDALFVYGADHSTERNIWATAEQALAPDGRVIGRINYYADTTFERTGYWDIPSVSGPSGPVTSQPIHVFFTGDGQTTLAVADAYTLADRWMLHISGP